MDDVRGGHAADRKETHLFRAPGILLCLPCPWRAPSRSRPCGCAHNVAYRTCYWSSQALPRASRRLWWHLSRYNGCFLSVADALIETDEDSSATSAPVWSLLGATLLHALPSSSPGDFAEPRTWQMGVTHSSDSHDVAAYVCLERVNPGDSRWSQEGSRWTPPQGRASSLSACSFSRCSGSSAILGSRPAVLP